MYNRFALTVLLLVVAHVGLTAERKIELKVIDPYVELHTGPGRGYPIFYVAERGEWIEVLFRQTDWFKVRTKDKKIGWVSSNQLKMTLDPSGQRSQIKEPGPEDFRVRNWEYGAVLGNFSGATVMSLYAGYHFTENISTELSVSHVLGSASSSLLVGVHLVQEPFPEWPVSPFISLGTGVIKTTPKATLALTQDRTDQYAHVGIGARMHLTKRFLLRLEYRRYVIFSSRNENEDIDEWKAGFGFFF